MNIKQITSKEKNYEITDKGTDDCTLRIYVKINEHGTSLSTNHNSSSFKFINSDPKIIKKIGRMIWKAGIL